MVRNISISFEMLEHSHALLFIHRPNQFLGMNSDRLKIREELIGININSYICILVMLHGIHAVRNVVSILNDKLMIHNGQQSAVFDT